MLRLALLALIVVVGALAALTLLPERRATVPEALISLSGARVALYPRADPEAVWRFSAPTVSYNPNRRETTLLDITDGRRMVGELTDFTLASDRIVIDRSDDLRGETIHAHLVEDEIDLLMESRGERTVLIDQDTARFEVPRATMTGPDMGASIFEDMRISFDFTEFEAGGPGTVGYAEFIIRE